MATKLSGGETRVARTSLRGLLIAAAIGIGLVACKGGANTAAPTAGNGGDGSNTNSPPPGAVSGCTTITGGTTSVTTNVDAGCTGCSIANAQSAADGNLSTSATLTVNGAAPGQGASIRVTAQNGIVFPAGQNAGAFISNPSGTAQDWTIIVRTYLNGVLQESVSNTSGACGACGNGGSAFEGLTTSKQFDAVEVFVNNNQAPGNAPDFGVYEFCSDYEP